MQQHHEQQHARRAVLPIRAVQCKLQLHKRSSCSSEHAVGLGRQRSRHGMSSTTTAPLCRSLRPLRQPPTHSPTKPHPPHVFPIESALLACTVESGTSLSASVSAAAQGIDRALTKYKVECTGAVYTANMPLSTTTHVITTEEACEKPSQKLVAAALYVVGAPPHTP